MTFSTPCDECVVVDGMEGKVMDAFKLFHALTRRYEKMRSHSGRAITAALAMALYREGLPMAAAKHIDTIAPKPGPSGLLIVNLVRPGAVVHEYIVTPSGLDEVRRLLQEAQSQYTTTLSLVRSLQYEAAGFRDTFDLSVTPLDAYALKLYSLNLLQYLAGKYSAKRLKLVTEHILSRVTVLAALES
jgi:hypothetical protein